MSKSSYRLLLDENVEREAKRRLENRGHDVEMVVDVLDAGASDDEVEEYATETGRLILTSDDDFLSRGYPTLFQEHDEMPAVEIARIVDAVAEKMSQSQLEQYNGTKLVQEWL